MCNKQWPLAWNVLWNQRSKFLISEVNRQLIAIFTAQSLQKAWEKVDKVLAVKESLKSESVSRSVTFDSL